MAEENKTEVNTEEQVDQDQVDQVDQQVPESISLNDLQLLANIVDLASGRGAFRGAELSQVGAVFDRLNNFLSIVAQSQQAEAEVADAPTDAEAEAPAEGE